MDYEFSCIEKGNGCVSLPRNGMDGTNSAELMEDNCWGLDLEDSLSDVSEMTKFDAYSEWCSNLGDQMFPSFISTNFSPLDVFNFAEQSNSEMPLVDDEIVGNASVNRGKLMFQQRGQLAFPANSAANRIELIDNSSSHHNVYGEVENSGIPRTLPESLSDKMLRALYLFEEMSGGGILAQVWVPMKNGDQRVLSTFDQPYLLDKTLTGYREISRSFTFDAESKPGSFPGLPGRVFTSKVPEWTSNVRYYNKAEYLRVQHAVHHEVRGSIALPVFEENSPKKCCAVLEIVTVKEKSNFNSEMENVCRALQAVKLKSSAPPTVSPKALSKHQRAAMSEITNMLRAICHAHRLPLGLTWIPCSYMEGSNDETIKVRNGRCNLAPNEKSILCIENSACFVNDKNMHGFVHACEEQYLEEGQGIVGKSLQSNHPFFYPDVKEYHISEYPLVQHARRFGLNAAVAIRLKSTYTGENDYILELFLPVDMTGSMEQQLLLNNLSSTMQRMCKSLRTVSDAELIGTAYSKFALQGEVAKPIVLSRSTSELLLSSGNSDFYDCVTHSTSESVSAEMEGDGLHEKAWAASTKYMEKKRSTTEKHVSLSVLQQYFSGSLKDAAKSIGVCPTTLKRICRQHGISRWPSRKINKVNRSLRKIQSVLDSVQGMEGGLKFDSTVVGLLTPGSIIRDLDSKRTLVSSITSPNARNTDSKDIGSTVVKTENEFFVDENHIGLNFTTPSFSNVECKSNAFESMMNLEASESHFVCRSSSPMVTVGEIDTDLKNETWMDGDDGVVENNQLASSVMTDSSNGSSGIKGSSSSSQSSAERSNPKAGESGSKITFKATYKEDMIRFKLEPRSGCIQLYEEVAKRFKLYMGHFQLKYLDDEDEWVLLVSDSDLNECLEILDFLGTRSVKLLVRDMPIPMGNSGGSSSFLLGGDST